MKVHDGVSGRLREFVEAQPVFFVATAPAGADGHVNVSPKGMRGTFPSGATTRSRTSTTTAAGPRRSPTCARTAASR